MAYIVELEPGVWLAEWSGDPGRTLDRGFAKRYERRDSAMRFLRKARLYRPFRDAKIIAEEPTNTTD